MQPQLASSVQEPRRDPHAGVLRFITAGSVDDGKSTLIGRLLHDTGAVYDDQLKQLSTARGARGSTADNLALLTDGLRAEREQGITIDIAHRYFATARRKFIVIDAPGHVQYTRNMVTGASCAQLAVVLVDVREGLVEQSRRHAYLASLLGVPELVFAVNKMDIVSFEEQHFRSVSTQIADWAGGLNGRGVRTIPVSALYGDNIAERSDRMPWYDGPTLLEHLENVDVRPPEGAAGFRLPVQWVLQGTDADPDRGYAGVVSGASVRPGASVVVLPGGQHSRVREVRTYDGLLERARPGQSVALALTDDVDASRGEMLCDAHNPPRVGTRLEATLAWMGTEPLCIGRPYAMRHATRWVRGRVTRLAHEVDVRTLRTRADASTLSVNQIGHVEVETSVPIAYDTYDEDRSTGAFILVDEASHETVAAGMLREPGAGRSGTRHGLYLIGTGAGDTDAPGRAIERALRQSGSGGVDIQRAAHGPQSLLEDEQKPASSDTTLLVCGIAGWRTPLPTGKTHADLARELGIGVAIAVELSPDCANHAILTAEAIRSDGLDLVGWVAKGRRTAEADAIIAVLKRELDAPLLGHVASADVADLDTSACARACRPNGGRVTPSSRESGRQVG